MQQDLDTGKPYSDVYVDNVIIRSFDLDVDVEELIWHRDKRNRIVTILSGEGWKLQMDNQIPLIMNVNSVFIIPKEMYHRILKGKTKLLVQIQEFD